MKIGWYYIINLDAYVYLTRAHYDYIVVVTSVRYLYRDRVLSTPIENIFDGRYTFEAATSAEIEYYGLD